ncbi:MAG: InlB B-repeat-containing protein [Bacilli bacterium]|nr:InlB B-repeat-containing protein [Bacilli bacterium]
MRNRGFTFIELLGVVIVLGVLTLVAFPLILKQINSAKEGIKKANEVLIIDGAKDYYEDNKTMYRKFDGVSYCIDIETLKQKNYINGNLKDENNEYIDTTGQVKLTYLNNNFKYEVVDSCNYYTVTFDPNGGSVSTTEKQVLENSLYGDLPIPTREGYTFMGWNGKNLLNLEDYIMENDYCKVTSDSITILKSDVYTSCGGPNIPLVSGNTYTISVNKDGDFTGRVYAFFGYSFYSVDSFNSFVYSGSDDKGRLMIVQNNESSTYDINIHLVSDKVVFSNIQLEDGDVATRYEPYYVTSDVLVTQHKNHTLKAIWKANS